MIKKKKNVNIAQQEVENNHSWYHKKQVIEDNNLDNKYSIKNFENVLKDWMLLQQDAD